MCTSLEKFLGSHVSCFLEFSEICTWWLLAFFLWPSGAGADMREDIYFHQEGVLSPDLEVSKPENTTVVELRVRRVAWTSWLSVRWSCCQHELSPHPCNGHSFYLPFHWLRGTVDEIAAFCATVSYLHAAVPGVANSLTGPGPLNNNVTLQRLSLWRMRTTALFSRKSPTVLP